MSLGVCAVLSVFEVSAEHTKSEPQVRARLYVMEMLEEYAGKLDAYVSSEAPFDQDRVRTVAAEIGELARRIPLLFPDHVPSELPKIADDFEGFTAMSLELADLADEASAAIKSLDEAKALNLGVQGYCQLCHDRYLTN